jgi:hypothetical protein
VESLELIRDGAGPRALVQLALRACCAPNARAALAAALVAPGVDWEGVCRLADAERVAPLLHVTRRGLPAVPAAVATRLGDAYQANASRNLHYRRELGGVLDALARAGIPVLVLKGAALIETLYSDSAVRRMSDMDLLVHRRDLAGARVTLAPLGFATLRVEPRPGAAVEYENQYQLRKEGTVRTRVELHWSLFDSPYYQETMSMDWFWESSEPAAIAGRRARVLSPTAQVLHLCGHLRLHHSGGELRWLHDIAQLIATQGARIDWSLVLDRARRFDLVLSLRDVLGRVVADWGTAVPPPVLERLQALVPSRREARVFRWLTQPDPSVARRLWVDVLTQPGWSRRLAFVGLNLIPSAAYMRQRYGIRHALLVPLYYPYRWLRALRGAR